MWHTVHRTIHSKYRLMRPHAKGISNVCAPWGNWKTCISIHWIPCNVFEVSASTSFTSVPNLTNKSTAAYTLNESLAACIKGTPWLNDRVWSRPPNWFSGPACGWGCVTKIPPELDWVRCLLNNFIHHDLCSDAHSLAHSLPENWLHTEVTYLLISHVWAPLNQGSDWVWLQLRVWGVLHCSLSPLAPRAEALFNHLLLILFVSMYGNLWPESDRVWLRLRKYLWNICSC